MTAAFEIEHNGITTARDVTIRWPEGEGPEILGSAVPGTYGRERKAARVVSLSVRYIWDELTGWEHGRPTYRWRDVLKSGELGTKLKSETVWEASLPSWMTEALQAAKPAVIVHYDSREI